MRALLPAILAAWMGTLGSGALAADLGDSAGSWAGTRLSDSASNTGWGEPSNGYSCGPCREWYGQVESLFLDRSNNTNRLAVIRVQDETTPLPGSPLLTAGDPNFDFEPGVRALVGWWLDECSAVELSYFGIFDWRATASVGGNNDLAIPGDLGLASLDFFAADQITLTYQARLHNAEFNYVSSYGDVSLLAGFRYLSLHEEFNIRATDLDTDTSNYNVRTSNDLYGGQVGVRYESWCNGFGWEATGKAGLLGNAARQTQFVTDFPPVFLLRGERRASGGQVAFVGDINLSGIYQLSDTWDLRAGYNVVWIEGVALAPNQLDFTDTATSGTNLHAASGLFLHGVNFGVEACW
jgi:Putative beta barrel porin-7 (BBP7)